MQTWAAYEMQRVLHCCSSGCRFSICFADADELNSSLIGKHRVEHRVWSALQHPRCLLIIQATSLWNVGAYRKVNLLSKISFRTLPQKRGLGICGKLGILPKDPVAGNDQFRFCRLQGPCCRCRAWKGSVQALHLGEIAGLRAFVCFPLWWEK